MDARIGNPRRTPTDREDEKHVELGCIPTLVQSERVVLPSASDPSEEDCCAFVVEGRGAMVPKQRENGGDRAGPPG